MARTPTTKDILDGIQQQLCDIREDLPNGNMAIIKNAIDDLTEGQKELKDDMREIKRQLLDPDNGVVIRVNKNTEVRKYWENRNDEIEGRFNNIKNLMKWHSGVNKALWILFTAVVGIVVKLLINFN
tara:strand:- start:5 stop:385 length:381 start_codon:yes stop_codon:yes gene_type:complete